MNSFKKSSVISSRRSKYLEAIVSNAVSMQFFVFVSKVNSTYRSLCIYGVFGPFCLLR